MSQKLNIFCLKAIRLKCWNFYFYLFETAAPLYYVCHRAEKIPVLVLSQYHLVWRIPPYIGTSTDDEDPTSWPGGTRRTCAGGDWGHVACQDWLRRGRMTAESSFVWVGESALTYLTEEDNNSSIVNQFTQCIYNKVIWAIVIFFSPIIYIRIEML